MSYKREVWSYGQADYQGLNDDISNFNWIELFENTDSVNESSDLFTKHYLALSEKYIPRRIITVRTTDKPWFNSEIRKEIRKRERLRKKARSTNSPAAILRYKKTKKSCE